MSLETPEKIRTLQRKLYLKAKAEPNYRFYLLYDKIWREDIFRLSYALARANSGSAGLEGETFDQMAAKGLEGGIGGLRREGRQTMNRHKAVRRGRRARLAGRGTRDGRWGGRLNCGPRELGGNSEQPADTASRVAWP